MEGEKEYSIRNRQLKFRIAEVVRTLNLMEELNKGCLPKKKFIWRETIKGGEGVQPNPY